MLFFDRFSYPAMHSKWEPFARLSVMLQTSLPRRASLSYTSQKNSVNDKQHRAELTPAVMLLRGHTRACTAVNFLTAVVVSVGRCTPCELVVIVLIVLAEGDVLASDLHHPWRDGGDWKGAQHASAGTLHLPPVQWKGHLPPEPPCHPQT